MDRHAEKRDTDNSHKGLFRRNLVDRCLCVWINGGVFLSEETKVSVYSSGGEKPLRNCPNTQSQQPFCTLHPPSLYSTNESVIATLWKSSIASIWMDATGCNTIISATEICSHQTACFRSFASISVGLRAGLWLGHSSALAIHWYGLCV